MSAASADLWIVGGVALALLVIIAVRTARGADRNTVSWWAARNRFRYVNGTGRLLSHVGAVRRSTGEPAATCRMSFLDRSLAGPR